MPKRKIAPNKESSRRTVSHDDLTPQIQEFQNLMDLESQKVENIRQSYSRQNSLLAKDNSILKIKVNSLEKKISQLVQENVTLRSKTSISEAIYRERLSNQLQVIENGIIQRFDEIFYMFENVRKNENLPSSSLRTMLKRTSSRSRSCSLSSPTYSKSYTRLSNHENNLSHESSFNKDDGPDLEPKAKKRKSSRRQSMFVSTSLEPEDETGENEPMMENSSVEVLAESHESAQVEETIDALNPEEENSDSVSNFTNSIIEYSIPEENPTEPEHSSSKLEIFNDSTNMLSTVPSNPLPLPLPGPSATLPTTTSDASTVYPSSSSSTNSHPKTKIKHSMKPPRIELKKKVIDEVMPVSNMSSNSEISFTRTRRTRGKAVDYTLPSLRAKMRRPSEKLVDATTVIDIHDLQVSKRNRETSHKRKSLSQDSIPDEPQLREVVVSKDYGTPKGKKTEDEIHEDTAHLMATSNNNSNNKNEKKLTSNNSPKKSSPLLDITNKSENKKKSTRTKKLFKNAIVNNLSDENSTTRPSKSSKGTSNNNNNYNNFDNNNSNINNVNNKSVSFRLNEDDLAVFDLFGNGKAVKHQPKTYRTKK
ncbi:BMC_2a_G0049930.mRNA.1.CDS.1 [Saccharomyces cerevisiae]|nr:Sgo1p [Saccharomyces cerevisiae YJM1447]CAI4709309.1 BMC_2a_G0049930.mRNA.1.CDS.1 [Saccharomyces cerevisiae]CAI4716390.1 BMB_G0049890.mRNA.1.CDS.1 [Saccharomyces cerevisiae]CAI7296330.1 BMC_2a_G0049930.mRNA.1.CDS.1 [Saccharomyces cerevisiae]CAI7299207.1 BMB_G0049890.mRNA.1.CDS.1 [Saccharomyces cerevisiae]